MMRLRAKGISNVKESPAIPGGATEWEVRPGGMLVQKRNPTSAAAVAAAVPTIRVKVKYGSAYHEIYITSQSTFGELKKLLSERTGLHPQDQKLVYRDKEREPGAFLDTSGVKDGSKMTLREDPTAQAKRLLELRRTSKIEKAAKSISSIGLEIDRLASQVSALECIVAKGGKVAESDVLNLTELLMMQLIKLDGVVVVADGDAKKQRGMQVRRVQKFVETLDALKIKNSILRRNGQTGQKHQPAVVVTTKWETFDSLMSPATSGPTATSAAPTPRFDWELF